MKSAKLFLSGMVLLAMVFASSMQAQAALEYLGTDSEGNRLIYDTHFDITWYDYTHSADTWTNQMAWATGLSITYGGTVYDDWRMPTALNQDGSGPCGGFTCDKSEMGHLYHVELGKPTGDPLSNTGDFQHLRSGVYWLGTESVQGASYAWDFNTNNGNQWTRPQSESYYAIAVRTGRALVPEPVSSALFIVGAATFGFRRLRNKYMK